MTNAHTYDTITLTRLGHACVLLDIPRDGEAVRILIDPGSLAPPLSAIADLDAILITHAHQDHITPEQIVAATGGEPVPLYGGADSIALAQQGGISDVRLVEPGTFAVAGIEVQVSKWDHEVIYPGVPLPDNLGFRIAGTVFAPGDAFAKPAQAVDVLLLPIGAPWMKLSEVVDYVRAVAPRIAVPIHDGGLAAPHRQMHCSLLKKFAPEGTDIVAAAVGEAVLISSS